MIITAEWRLTKRYAREIRQLAGGAQPGLEHISIGFRHTTNNDYDH